MICYLVLATVDILISNVVRHAYCMHIFMKYEIDMSQFDDYCNAFTNYDNEKAHTFETFFYMFIVGRHSALFSMGFSIFTGVAYGCVISIFKITVEKMKPTNDQN